MFSIRRRTPPKEGGEARAAALSIPVLLERSKGVMPVKYGRDGFRERARGIRWGEEAPGARPRLREDQPAPPLLMIFSGILLFSVLIFLAQFLLGGFASDHEAPAQGPGVVTHKEMTRDERGRPVYHLTVEAAGPEEEPGGAAPRYTFTFATDVEGFARFEPGMAVVVHYASGGDGDALHVRDVLPVPGE